MNANRPSNRIQAIAANEEDHRGIRFFAGLLAIVALLALFVYRAATTDPLWNAANDLLK